ncbi:MAG: FHA domain-containing protein [Planctomycetota bacterium]
MAGAAAPELVFLAGPQRGQRAVVMGNTAVLGRAEDADIRATEPSVSRRQLQFTLTPDGWIVENLSDRSIRINGKKYKRKKKVLLETGDLLGVGASTEMLYVGPGDDPQEALGQYRPEMQMPPPTGEAAEGAPSAPAEAVQPAHAAPAREAPEGEGPETQRLDHVDQEQRKRKRRRYAIIFGADILLVLALVLWLSTGSDDSPGETADRPRVLTKVQIEDMLTAPRQRGRDLSRAEDRIESARRYYTDRYYRPSHLYRCVKAYREALAYSGRSSFASYKDSDKLRDAERELVRRVFKKYTQAWHLERQQRWRDAREAFGQVLRLVPERDLDDPAYAFVQNVKKHRAYVNRHISRED